MTVGCLAFKLRHNDIEDLPEHHRARDTDNDLGPVDNDREYALTNSTSVYNIWSNETEEIGFDLEIAESYLGDREMIWRLIERREGDDASHLAYYSLRQGEDGWTDFSSRLPVDSEKTQISIHEDRAVWTDRGRGAIPLDGRRDVYLFDMTSGEETLVTDHPLWQVNPDIHGDRIVWMDWRHSPPTQGVSRTDIYMYDLETGQTTQLTDSENTDRSPRINSEYITWSTSTEGLKLYSLEDEEIIQTWSDDRVRRKSLTDDYLFFQEEETNNVYKYDLETGQEELFKEIDRDMRINSMDASEDYVAVIYRPDPRSELNRFRTDMEDKYDEDWIDIREQEMMTEEEQEELNELQESGLGQRADWNRLELKRIGN